MDPYVLAFGILGFGLGLAAVMWGVPRARRRLAVRRFRRRLDRLDAVVSGWREALSGGGLDGPAPRPSPEEPRRGRRRDDDDGGMARA